MSKSQGRCECSGLFLCLATTYIVHKIFHFFLVPEALLVYVYSAMTFQTYDAHGNPVGPGSIFCTCCGQHIKNVTYFRGKPYGPECIKTVTGEPKDSWLIRDGHIDEEGTAKRKADREAERVAQEQAAAKAKAERKEWRVARMWAIEALVGPKASWVVEPDEGSWKRWRVAQNNLLFWNPHHDDFNGNGYLVMLASRLLNERTVDWWVTEKVADVIGRQSGRRNSKAYTAAFDACVERMTTEGIYAEKE